MSLEHFYKDKIVLITGASMGIGKELARQVLDLGGKVVLTARNAERLQGVQKEFEKHADRILIHVGDVTSYEDNALLMNEIHEYFGNLDILINNAGLSAYGDLEEIQPEVVKQVIDTNIYGAVYPVMTALKQFKSSINSVFFVSSIAGFHGLPGYSAYSLSKRSLQALAQSLSVELHAKGIFVGLANVGFTENDKHKKTLSPLGHLENIPPRPKRLLVTREKTARRILTQIMRRKHTETHSLFGKFVFLLSTYFPSLMSFFLRRQYNK